MRRYAPAFTEAVVRVAGIRNDIILARVHDVIGANQLIIDSTSSVFRDPEGVAALAAKAKADMAEAVRLAIGAQSPEKSCAYELLLGLRATMCPRRATPGAAVAGALSNAAAGWPRPHRGFRLWTLRLPVRDGG